MRLLKFYATWCEPCKQLSKVIERNKENISTLIEIVEVDVDTNLTSAKEFQIRSVPTLVMLNDEGKEVQRHHGFMNDQQFKEFCIVRKV